MSSPQQVACGVDVVSDGEMGKIAYTFYVKHRLSGIQVLRNRRGPTVPKEVANLDMLEHPEFAEKVRQAARWLGAAIWPALGRRWPAGIRQCVTLNGTRPPPISAMLLQRQNRPRPL